MLSVVLFSVLEILVRKHILGVDKKSALSFSTDKYDYLIENYRSFEDNQNFSVRNKHIGWKRGLKGIGDLEGRK